MERRFSPCEQAPASAASGVPLSRCKTPTELAASEPVTTQRINDDDNDEEL